jgi:hypothetical protein
MEITRQQTITFISSEEFKSENFSFLQLLLFLILQKNNDNNLLISIFKGSWLRRLLRLYDILHLPRQEYFHKNITMLGKILFPKTMNIYTDW